ncbi:hypothetical protein WA158_005214 [Blastocystis sp. Blastoise]
MSQLQLKEEIQFHHYQETDLEGAAKAFQKAFSAAPWSEEWPDLKYVERYLHQYVEEPRFLGYIGIYKGQVICGCFATIHLWPTGDECIIQELFVDPSFHSQGFGSKFITYIKEEVKKTGINCINLLTKRGFPAEFFYQKNGFSDFDPWIYVRSEF